MVVMGKGWRPRAATRSDAGMVTAELAVAIPALVAVVVALAWMLSLGAGQAMVHQAAREGARAAARGESTAEVRRIVGEALPGAQAQVGGSAEMVVVTVRSTRRPPARFLAPLGRTLTASASAWREQA